MSFRSAYLAGSTPKRNHQFWPTILRQDFLDLFVSNGFTLNEAKRIADRSCPASVSLKIMQAIAWRVREWKLEAADFNYTGLGAVGPANPWTLHADIPEIAVKMKRRKVPPDVDDPFRDVTDERDILGPKTETTLLAPDGAPDRWRTPRNSGIFGVTEPGDVTVSSNIPTPYLFSGGTASMSFLGNYVIYDPDTKLFYPPIGVFGNFSILRDTGTGQTTGVEAEYYTLPSYPPTAPPDPTPASGIAGDVQQGTLTIEILGEEINIPIGMFGQGAGSAPPVGFPDGGSGSIDLNMTVEKWWAHSENGNPLYDEDTGELL